MRKKVNKRCFKEKKKKPNYIVHYNNGKRPIECDSKKEVWDAISKSGWSGYWVESPIDLDIYEFIPF